MRKFLLSMIGVIIGLLSLLLIISLNVKYTVIFNTQGGSIYPSQEIPKGGVVVRPDDPIYPGFEFIGWYDVLGHEYDFSKPIYEDVEIVARYNRLEEENLI